MSSIEEISPSNRESLSALLDQRSPNDAMAAYFSLEHPKDRVKLYVARTSAGQAVGFLVKARTGYDLFRPFLVPFSATSDDLNDLLDAALSDTPQALIGLPPDQFRLLLDHFTISDLQLTQLLRLDPNHYRQIINVLILAEDTPDGWPRYEIRRGDTTLAAAGVNWMGKRFAEVYLDQTPNLEQDFAPSLLSSIAGRLLEDRKITLLRLADHDEGLVAAAEQVGFAPTGARTTFAIIAKG